MERPSCGQTAAVFNFRNERRNLLKCLSITFPETRGLHKASKDFSKLCIFTSFTSQLVGLRTDLWIPPALLVWKTFWQQINLASFVFWLMFTLQSIHVVEFTQLSLPIIPAYPLFFQIYGILYTLCQLHSFCDVHTMLVMSMIITFAPQSLKSNQFSLLSFKWQKEVSEAPRGHRQVYVVEMSPGS